MIGNKLEQDIVDIYNQDIAAHLSIHQISSKLGKSYPYINTKVHELIDEGIFRVNKVGRSLLCSINLESDKANILLSLNEIRKREKLLAKQKALSGIVENIHDMEKDFSVHTVFKQKKKIYFVLDHLHDKEAIKNRYPNIDTDQVQFLSVDQFLEKSAAGDFLTDVVVLHRPQEFFWLLQTIKEMVVYRGMYS